MHSSWNILFPFSSWLLRFNYLGRCLVARSSKNESIRTPQTRHDHMQNLRWENIWNTTLLLLLLRCSTPHDARLYWFLSFSCQKFPKSDKKPAPLLQFVRWKWTRNADSRRLRHQNELLRRKQPQTASNAGQPRRVQNERQRHVRICCGSEKKYCLENRTACSSESNWVKGCRTQRPPTTRYYWNVWHSSWQSVQERHGETRIEFLAGKKCNVKGLKRVGQFKDLSPKPRTLIVQVDNEACRTLLLKASRELKNYREVSRPVFLS